MPSPTTLRGLLGHFLRGADLPTVDQSVSPPPVLKLAAGAGVGGVRGGAGGCRSPRDGGGGCRGSGGRYRDGRGTMRVTEGAEQEKTEATAATVTATATTAAGGRRQTTEDPPARRRENGAGGGYRSGGRNTEESAYESAERDGEETEEPVS